MQQTLEDRLRNAPGPLKEVLGDARGRYCVVDNTASTEDRAELARKVLDMVKVSSCCE